MTVTDKNHLPLIHKRKQYIEVPLPMSCSLLYKLWMGLKGILLSPLYLVMASIAGAPGIGVHLRCAATGVRLLLTGRASLIMCYNYLFSPMDSTRYFEFHEVLNSLAHIPFRRYLDVSSPRLGPLYPFWRESYMMATEYRYFKTIDELPGEGVVMLEFVKP